MRDEQHRAGERLERGLERLPRLDVEVVRRLVEHEEVRAGGDEQREREPPPLPSRERRDGAARASPSPEKRKRPSRFCARGRCRPVAAAVASSTDPLVGSSSACCEK